MKSEWECQVWWPVGVSNVLAPPSVMKSRVVNLLFLNCLPMNDVALKKHLKTIESQIEAQIAFKCTPITL